MTKRKSEIDDTTVEVAEAFIILERLVHIIGKLGRELNDLKRSKEKPKKSKKSKKKSKGKSR